MFPVPDPLGLDPDLEESVQLVEQYLRLSIAQVLPLTPLPPTPDLRFSHEVPLTDPSKVPDQEVVDQVAISLLKVVDQTKQTELNRMQKFQGLNIVNHY